MDTWGNDAFTHTRGSFMKYLHTNKQWQSWAYRYRDIFHHRLARKVTVRWIDLVITTHTNQTVALIFVHKPLDYESTLNLFQVAAWGIRLAQGDMSPKSMIAWLKIEEWNFSKVRFKIMLIWIVRKPKSNLELRELFSHTKPPNLVKS